MNNPVRPDEWEYYLPLETMGGQRVKTMLELGDKINPKIGTYKDYFEGLGIEHTSVDWNGCNGAIPLDLRLPIDLGQFDMVTNIGTTEHVSNQAGVWENIHQACKRGGIIVSVTPLPGGKDWWWHGEYYPTENFYREFATINGYIIEKMGIQLEEPTRNLYVRMVKTADQKTFLMPKENLIYLNRMRPRSG